MEQRHCFAGARFTRPRPDKVILWVYPKLVRCKIDYSDSPKNTQWKPLCLHQALKSYPGITVNSRATLRVKKLDTWGVQTLVWSAGTGWRRHKGTFVLLLLCFAHYRQEKKILKILNVLLIFHLFFNFDKHFF